MTCGCSSSATVGIEFLDGSVSLIEVDAQADEGSSTNGEDALLLDLINAYRAGSGVPSLVADDALTSAAQWMAQDMSARDCSATTQCLGHVDSLSRSIETRLLAFGVASDATGEIINGWTCDDAPGAFERMFIWEGGFYGWKRPTDPVDCEVIVDAGFTRAGVGCACNEDLSSPSCFWVVDFAGTQLP